jgi:hypothetical protein
MIASKYRKIALNCVGVLCALILLNSPSQSQTTIAGSVSGTWTSAGSPYVISDSTWVPPGDSLTIEPGVTVIIGQNLSIAVFGDIHAVGVAGNPITIKSPNSSVYWNSIYVNFQSVTDTSVFSYCNLSNGSVAITLSVGNSGGADTTVTSIQNCNFDNCLKSAIYGNSQGGYCGYACYTWPYINPIVVNSTFNATGNGCSFLIFNGGNGGTGFANPIITNNIFSNLSGAALLLNSETADEGAGASAPVFVNNIVNNCGTAVSTQDPYSATIRNNIFSNDSVGISQSGSNTTQVGFNCFFNNGTNFVGFPSSYGSIVMTNHNGTPCDIAYNIFQDPMFNSTGDQLQPSSPCVDAGDPDSIYFDVCHPPSLGSDINDVGAFGGHAACEWITTGLSSPVLLSPSNGATNQPTTVTLSWGTSTMSANKTVQGFHLAALKILKHRKLLDGSFSCEVQISTNSSFGGIIKDTTLTDTSVTISGLNFNTLYYWRVDASDSVGTSEWSSVWNFTTSPPPPVLLSPPDSSTNLSGAVTLIWDTASASAASKTARNLRLTAVKDLKRKKLSAVSSVLYQVEVGTDSTFATNVFLDDSALVDTFVTVSGLTPATKYYWRVNAEDSAGIGAWSSVWNFTTAPPAPLITSFSPASGPIGTTVTISGENFGSTPANNIVFFGAVRAVVTAASPTSLTVTVPVSATYAPISVTTSGLTCYSNARFDVTFSNAGNFTASSFSYPVNFNGGTSPTAIAVADIDGDGKPDLVTTESYNDSVAVFRNTNIGSIITSRSLAAKVNFPTGYGTLTGLAIGDIDGDGKPDLVVTAGNSNSVLIYRNTSKTGSIDSSSFAAPVVLSTGNNPYAVAIADFNGDGRPDLVVTNQSDNTISVFQNMGTVGNIAFAPAEVFNTGQSPAGIAIADFDGDGMPDIAVANSKDSTVTVFLNTTSFAVISLVSVPVKVDYPASGIAAADIDGDGLIDLAVANTDGAVTVLRNTSTIGSIVFAPGVDFTVGQVVSTLAIGDLNGDGKPDIVASATYEDSIFILQNLSTSGSIAAGSFAPYASIAADYYTTGIALADLDGDGKPDIATANQLYDIVSVIQNEFPDAFAAPLLLSPANNTTHQPTTLTLNWSASGSAAGKTVRNLHTTAMKNGKNSKNLLDATTYEVRIGTDSTFESGVFMDSAGIVDTFQAVSHLSATTKYYWEVRTTNSEGTSAWSSIWSFTTFAGTLVHGSSAATNDNFVWTLVHSPYIVYDQDTIPAGQTLTIQPGVIVEIAASININILGSLSAIGTAIDSIVFTIYQSGQWGEITVANAAAFKYCHVQGGNTGIDIAGSSAPVTVDSSWILQCSTGIFLGNSASVVSNSTVSGNSTYGIYGEGGTVSNCIVSGSGSYGIYGLSGTFRVISSRISNNYYGIYCYTPFTVVSSSIQNNGYYGFYSEGGGSVSDSLIGSSISNNGNIGIYSNNRVFLQGDTISGNTAAGVNLVSGTGSSVISFSLIEQNIGAGINGVYQADTIENNDILFNTGDGVNGISSSTAVVLINNLVAYNSSYGLSSSVTPPPTTEFNDVYLNGTNFGGQYNTSVYGNLISTNRNGDPADPNSNISLSPQFVDSATQNYHLQATSHLRNAGDSLTHNTDGTVSDIGAFPYLSAPQLLTPQLLSPRNGAANQLIPVMLRWNTSTIGTNIRSRNLPRMIVNVQKKRKPATGSLTYHVQVATDNLFSQASTVFDSTVADTFAAVDSLQYSNSYNWRVDAENATDTSAWTTTPWTFTTLYPPGTVTLLSPGNDSTNLPLTPVLRWTSSATATSYHVRIATDSNFINVVFDSPNWPDTFKTASGLALTTTYYWEVLAINAAGTGNWSNKWSFTTTSVPPPSVPVLLLPADGAANQPVTSLIFSWNSVSSSPSRTIQMAGRSAARKKSKLAATIQYHLQVGTDSLFAATPLVDDTLSDTTISVSGLMNGTTYYWHVAAQNAGNSSAFSGADSFLTVLSIPTLLSPPAGATGQATTLTLSWNTVTGASFYDLQVSTDSSFVASLAFNLTNIVDTSEQVTPLAYATHYYWRVGVAPINPLEDTTISRSDFATLASVSLAPPSITFSNSTVSTSYRLISWPGANSENVSNIVQGTQGTNWRMFSDPGSGAYVELGSGNNLLPGQGYWFLMTSALNVVSQSIQMPSLATDGTYSISLHGGWNIIGNPFDRSVQWFSVQSVNGISYADTISDYEGFWIGSMSMTPFKGYYYLNSTGAGTLKIPYPSSVVSPKTQPFKPDWTLQLVFQSDINRDASNYIGIVSSGNSKPTKLNSHKPPLIFDQGFLYFNHAEWDSSYPRFRTDYRPALGDGQVWDFEIFNPRSTPGKITVNGIDHVPAGYSAVLIDHHDTSPIDLRQSNEYRYTTVSQKMDFSIIVGNKEYLDRELANYLPSAYQLSQNYPNPFNPTTSISFAVPAQSAVRLEIYSVLGERVKTLVDGRYSRAVYTVVWDGKDDAGQTVASGVYFYRLISNGNVIGSKKMLMIR